MQSKYRIVIMLTLALILVAIMLLGDNELLPFLVPIVFAHCDTMSGPVIQAAQKALETGNINLILIWVQKKDEAEIKKAFQKTLAVRKLSPEARELADMYFFETLVRIHRAGEGAPYTGIKPAGAEVEPGIEAADKAVESGFVDSLVKDVSEHVASGIRKRFNEVMEKKKHMNENVEAGREYVEAYVTFIHYVEGIHNATAGKGVQHGEAEGVKVEEAHKH